MSEHPYQERHPFRTRQQQYPQAYQYYVPAEQQYADIHNRQANTRNYPAVYRQQSHLPHHYHTNPRDPFRNQHAYQHPYQNQQPLPQYVQQTQYPSQPPQTASPPPPPLPSKDFAIAPPQSQPTSHLKPASDNVRISRSVQNTNMIPSVSTNTDTTAKPVAGDMQSSARNTLQQAQHHNRQESQQQQPQQQQQPVGRVKDKENVQQKQQQPGQPKPPAKASTQQRHQPHKNLPPPPSVIVDRKGRRQYARGDLLGEGGFARCYGVTEQTGAKLAAKVIPKVTLKNDKQKQKNIVKFIRVFEDDENVYMILELCENKTFVDMLKKRRRLTEPEVRYYMYQLLDAVRYMHQNRVIHRDLKLGNLFLTRDMALKLGDFGLAANIKIDGERKKTICGTPNYIAPEVLFDTQNGHSYEVDIWSLGVVMKIREASYEFPSNVEISPQARSIITALLHTRPECRPLVNDVMQHEFFTMQPILQSVPVSALLTPPGQSSSTPGVVTNTRPRSTVSRNPTVSPATNTDRPPQSTVDNDSNKKEPVMEKKSEGYQQGLPTEDMNKPQVETAPVAMQVQQQSGARVDEAPRAAEPGHITTSSSGSSGNAVNGVPQQQEHEQQQQLVPPSVASIVDAIMKKSPSTKSTPTTTPMMSGTPIPSSSSSSASSSMTATTTATMMTAMMTSTISTSSQRRQNQGCDEIVGSMQKMTLRSAKSMEQMVDVNQGTEESVGSLRKMTLRSAKSMGQMAISDQQHRSQTRGYEESPPHQQQTRRYNTRRTNSKRSMDTLDETQPYYQASSANNSKENAYPAPTIVRRNTSVQSASSTTEYIDASEMAHSTSTMKHRPDWTGSANDSSTALERRYGTARSRSTIVAANGAVAADGATGNNGSLRTAIGSAQLSQQQEHQQIISRNSSRNGSALMTTSTSSFSDAYSNTNDVNGYSAGGNAASANTSSSKGFMVPLPAGVVGGMAGTNPSVDVSSASASSSSASSSSSSLANNMVTAKMSYSSVEDEVVKGMGTGGGMKRDSMRKEEKTRSLVGIDSSVSVQQQQQPDHPVDTGDYALSRNETVRGAANSNNKSSQVGAGVSDRGMAVGTAASPMDRSHSRSGTNTSTNSTASSSRSSGREPMQVDEEDAGTMVTVNSAVAEGTMTTMSKRMSVGVGNDRGGAKEGGEGEVGSGVKQEERVRERDESCSATSVLKRERALSATNGGAPRKSSQALEAMYRNINAGLGYLSKRMAGTGENVRTPQLYLTDRSNADATKYDAPKVFITKWIDYTNKYGLGYQLRDGSVGVYFNDSTSIVLAADNHHFEYFYDRITPTGERGPMNREPYVLTNFPPHLEKKVILLQHFRDYMQENLFKACPYPCADDPPTHGLEYLT
ncbi:Cell cycle serine/threonine-protein kinase cdc5/MSD2, partial [Quaeritorhiza haematococci]